MQALVLAGGGAKGAFQARVQAHLHAKGYRWGVIAGVSVGALNAAMIGTGRRTRLAEIWSSTRDRDVYTGGFGLRRAIGLWHGAYRSLYDNEPLRRMIKEEYHPNDTEIHTIFGVVSLGSGRYVQTHVDPGTEYNVDKMRKWLLASTVIPITFPPVRIGTDQFVDGGVRNITPLADVMPFEPDEVVVITTEQVPRPRQDNDPETLLEDGRIVLDALLAEIIWNDIKWARKINNLVRQAEEGGITLEHPIDERPLRHVNLRIIMPDEDLGSALDFSREAYQRRVEAADRVIERPIA